MKSDLWATVLAPLIRSLLQIGAGYLLAEGYITAENVEGLIAAGLAIGTAAWSIREKKKNAELHAAKNEIIVGQQAVIQQKTAEMESIK